MTDAHIHGIVTAAGAKMLCCLWTNAADPAIVTIDRLLTGNRPNKII